MFYDHILRKWPEAACTLFFGAVHGHSVVRHKRSSREGTEVKAEPAWGLPRLWLVHLGSKNGLRTEPAQGDAVRAPLNVWVYFTVLVFCIIHKGD